VLIQALPEDYNFFISSLLLKDNLDKAAVQIPFVREDNQRRCHQEGWHYARAKDQVGKN